jgi:hypothetical protein
MTDLTHWPTEAEAAAVIGCSVRTLQRYAGAGKIEIRTRPREGKKPENVCNPRDVDKLLPAAHVMPPEDDAERSNDRTPPANGVPAVNNFGNGKQIDTFFAFIAAITTIVATRQNVAKPEPRLWLTLDEAAELSGLTAAYIRDRARVGAINAAAGGPYGALRIQRASLEAFAG